MEQAKKQRVVGVIVLVALAVIVIPTLLDFSQDKPDDLARIEVPEAPDPMKMKVLPLDVWSQKEDPQVESTPLVEEGSPSRKPQAAPARQEAKPAPKPNPEPKAAEAEAKPAASPASKSKPKPKPEATVQAKAKLSPEPKAEPIPLQPEKAESPSVATGATTWVVQVASFSAEESALTFRNKLRNKGFAADVVRGDSRGKVVYRVRTAPELLRSSAESLQKRIKKEMGYEGLVMQYK